MVAADQEDDMLTRPISSEFSVANEPKPARRFVAQAIPFGSKFMAQWAAPGMIPNYVDDGGSAKIYEEAGAAEDDARRILFEALNSGIHRDPSRSKLAAYEKMTGPELAVALADLDVSPTWFAFIMATNYQRVIDWMTGAQDIPHTVRVMIEIFKRDPAAMDAAEATTRAVASERVRHPPRQEQPE
jgi:DNA-binding transcriptional regulator YiaG